MHALDLIGSARKRQRFTTKDTKVSQSPLFHHVRIQHALLFEIMRNRVLSQQRSLQPNLRSYPLAFGVRRAGGMPAVPAGPELRTKGSALNLVELLQLTPGLVAHRARQIDLEPHLGHNQKITLRICDKASRRSQRQ